jgi:hypothetical protein
MEGRDHGGRCSKPNEAKTAIEEKALAPFPTSEVTRRSSERRFAATCNTAKNMTTLRHAALNIVEQDETRKLDLPNCRKRAGWDRN